MIQSLVRSMEVLEILGSEPRAFSLIEISQAAQLPPSTVHRVLQTFCSQGYVVKEESTHLYKLGPALVALGISASRQVDLRRAVMPRLRDLTALIGEDSYMVIRNGFKGLIMDKVEGPSQLKVVEHFGYEQDLHVGGIRKSLLAYSPEEFIEQYCEYYAKKHGVVDTRDMIESLEKVREDGVSITTGEYIKEGIGVGCPVFDGHGDVVASVGDIMPVSRAHGDNFLEVKDQVKLTAHMISRDIGYSKIKLK